MKGMGSYTSLEIELNYLSIDELNELYYSGELDKIYEEFERTGEVKIRIRKYKGKGRKRSKRGVE
jgi:hypothetical protein